MSQEERNLRLHIMVTHEELTAIRERMAEVNSQKQSAFIRKLAADGYAVNVSYKAAISCILRFSSVRICNGSKHSHLSPKLKRIL